jgi:hypothetical protein
MKIEVNSELSITSNEIKHKTIQKNQKSKKNLMFK